MILGFSGFSYAESRDLELSKVIEIRDSLVSCQSVNRLSLRHIIIYQSVSGLFRNLEPNNSVTSVVTRLNRDYTLQSRILNLTVEYRVKHLGVSREDLIKKDNDFFLKETRAFANALASTYTAAEMKRKLTQFLAVIGACQDSHAVMEAQLTRYLTD
jgi:hypothetical protein